MQPPPASSAALPLASRLVALLDHLGIRAAYIATQMPGDVADLCAAHPDRVAGVVLAVPVRLDPAPFAAVARRLLIVAGETGIGRPVADAASAALPAARCHILAGYEAQGWADVAADRGGELVATMMAFLASAAIGTTAPLAAMPALAAAPPLPLTGRHAGLTFRIEGTGPPLLLLPFFLAASQWDPVLPALARQFTVIRVGGAHIGGVAALEERAALPTWQSMFRTLVDLMAPQPGEAVLDVGCGSGALDRLLAHRLGPGNPITAADVNGFLLAEASSLAAAEGLGADRIRFVAGSAIDLPFPDQSFGCAFSITVLEECDARRAIAELVRVVAPGGRVGVVVRAIDMPQWWSFAVPSGLERIANVPPQSVSTGGVADARLYAMLRDAGLVDLVAFPQLVTLGRTEGTLWRYREDPVLVALSPAERRQWEAARDTARAKGLLFQATPLHCAVATKPGSPS